LIFKFIGNQSLDLLHHQYPYFSQNFVEYFYGCGFDEFYTAVLEVDGFDLLTEYNAERSGVL